MNHHSILAIVLGRDSSSSALLVVSGLVLGGVLAVIVYFTRVFFQPITLTHWILLSPFAVGVPAFVAYKNDGLLTCWLYVFVLFLPATYIIGTQPVARDLHRSTPLVVIVGLTLILTALGGTVAFLLGAGGREAGRLLRGRSGGPSSN